MDERPGAPTTARGRGSRALRVPCLPPPGLVRRRSYRRTRGSLPADDRFEDERVLFVTNLGPALIPDRRVHDEDDLVEGVATVAGHADHGRAHGRHRYVNAVPTAKETH